MSEPIVKNAVTCGICQSPADRYSNMFVCQKNRGHMADLMTGIFSDLTFPESEQTVVTVELPIEAAAKLLTDFEADPDGMRQRFAEGGVPIVDIKLAQRPLCTLCNGANTPQMSDPCPRCKGTCKEPLDQPPVTEEQAEAYDQWLETHEAG